MDSKIDALHELLETCGYTVGMALRDLDPDHRHEILARLTRFRDGLTGNDDIALVKNVDGVMAGLRRLPLPRAP